MRMRLDGKVVLVTGARRGIGREIALTAAAEGADVALNDVTGEQELDAVAAAIEELGRRTTVQIGDVSDPVSVESMFAAASSELDGLDVLVNNAGVESIVPLLDITEEEWTRVTSTNLKGEFLCLQAAAREMVDSGKGGAIVNIGSVQAGMSMPGRCHYAPSKRAIEALTANAAAELAGLGIRVNCIHPGLIDTDMTAWVMQDPELKPTVLDEIAMKRAGEPDEIARAVVFFASDDASYITGQCLYVDGGLQIL
jgi:NAD(P)-dependent dehydrogenase (short-subunit alcohol dehydrogenase family)